jgi:hypothetical protein
MKCTVMPSRAASPPPALRRRVILLGASNVTRGLAKVIDASRLQLGGPLDVLAAIGHGRSYGRPSRVLGRRLTGILDCGLWDELARREPLPSVGLITDVGNDILLGVPLPTIQNWLELTFQRMRQACESLIVTELPLETIRQLSPRRFVVFRSLLFPKSRLQYGEAIELAHAVNQQLIELATRCQAALVRPKAEWYAIDPIHVRQRSAFVAWMSILGHWKPPSHEHRADALDDLLRQIAFANWRSKWSLRFALPLERQWFGWKQTCAQPARVLHDGTWVSLY